MTQSMKSIIEYRVKLLSKAKESNQLQAVEIESCKKDILYFFKTYLFTDRNNNLYSSEEPNIIPFMPYEFQEEYITEVWNSIMD